MAPFAPDNEGHEDELEEAKSKKKDSLAYNWFYCKLWACISIMAIQMPKLCEIKILYTELKFKFVMFPTYADTQVASEFVIGISLEHRCRF